MTLANLTLDQRTQLLRELDAASVQTSNVALTDYRPLRDVFAAWGFAPMTGDIARCIHDELDVMLNGMSAPASSWADVRKAGRTSKPAVKVGDIISYTTALGEQRTGIVYEVSNSGKSIYVQHADGSKGAASRNIQII